MVHVVEAILYITVVPQNMGCVMVDLHEIHITNHHLKILASQTTEKNVTSQEDPWQGGTVSCLIKFLHPSQLIRNKFPNPTSGQRLEGCITVCQEVKRINRKDQLSIVIHHNDFKEADEEMFQELYAVKKHFTIQAEGDPDFFFNLPVADDVQEEPQELLLPAVVDDKLMGENHGGQQNLISALTGVLDIDDNNEPVPENVPGDPFPLYSLWFGDITGFATGNPTI